MTTLTSSPVAEVLDQLFADAERTHAAFREREARSAENKSGDATAWRKEQDAREFYAEVKDVHLAVSRWAGDLLYLLARSRGARAIVEFGTSFGVSTIHLAAALRDGTGGRVISCEFEPSKVANARGGLADAGLGDLVEVREGDALDVLSRDLPESIDLVFLDGAKNLYADVLRLLEPRLATNALVVADNSSRSPQYLEHVRSGGGYRSMPFGDDVEVSLRLGGPSGK